MGLLLRFHLGAPASASCSAGVCDDRVAVHALLIQSTPESIRLVTRVRLETEQQNGQGANDYNRSHDYKQIVLVCQLHCHCARAGFDTPSFEGDSFGSIRSTVANRLSRAGPCSAHHGANRALTGPQGGRAAADRRETSANLLRTSDTGSSSGHECHFA